jgi:hypothetical protein
MTAWRDAAKDGVGDRPQADTSVLCAVWCTWEGMRRRVMCCADVGLQLCCGATHVTAVALHMHVNAVLHFVYTMLRSKLWLTIGAYPSVCTICLSIFWSLVVECMVFRSCAGATCTSIRIICKLLLQPPSGCNESFAVVHATASGIPRFCHYD